MIKENTSNKPGGNSWYIQYDKDILFSIVLFIQIESIKPLWLPISIFCEQLLRGYGCGDSPSLKKFIIVISC